MHVLYALRRRLKGGPRSSQGETHGETREALREDTTQNTPVTRHYPLISGRRQPRSRRWGHERSGPAAATKSTTHVHYVATSQLTSHLVLTLNCVLSTTGSPTIVPEKVYCGVRRQRRSPDTQTGSEAGYIILRDTRVTPGVSSFLYIGVTAASQRHAQ